MKYFLKILVVALMCTSCAFAAKDYEKMYNNAEVPQIKLMHDLDPYQNEDYFNYAYSPYPLFRTASTLYFKDLVITPGYYLLAARNIKGKDYIFFKAEGKVKFIVPAIETEVVLEDFYKRKMPVAKLTKWQKFKKRISDGWNKKFKNSKKMPPPSSYIEAKILDENFYEIVFYYGNKKYTMYFRTSSF